VLQLFLVAFHKFMILPKFTTDYFWHGLKEKTYLRIKMLLLHLSNWVGDQKESLIEETLLYPNAV
jgi:hypothetical protein